MPISKNTGISSADCGNVSPGSQIKVVDLACGPGNMALFCDDIRAMEWFGLELWPNELRQAANTDAYSGLVQANLFTDCPSESMPLTRLYSTKSLCTSKTRRNSCPSCFMLSNHQACYTFTTQFTQSLPCFPHLKRLVDGSACLMKLWPLIVNTTGKSLQELPE